MIIIIVEIFKFSNMILNYSKNSLKIFKNYFVKKIYKIQSNSFNIKYMILFFVQKFFFNFHK